MFEDISDLHINPSPPRPKQRPRSRVQNAVAAASGHANRKRRAAPSLQDRLKPLHPLSAQRPYLGEPHW